MASLLLGRPEPLNASQVAGRRRLSPLKVLVLGEAETGKTALIRKLTSDRFTSSYTPTSGVDFYLHEMRVRGTDVQLQLWDVAGRENAKNTYGVARVYAQDAVGAILVYDITRPDTFDTVHKWKRDLDAKITLPTGDPLPVALIGNKQDLETAQPDEEALTRFCHENGFAGWFDTSAKTGYDVDSAFTFLVEQILAHTDVIDRKYAVNAAYHPTASSSSTTSGLVGAGTPASTTAAASSSSSSRDDGGASYCALQ